MQKEGGSNSAGTASVILGILSIALGIGLYGIGAPVGIALAILALIFALVQKKSSNNNWAKWGIILSIIGIIINVLILIWIASIILELTKQIQDLQASGLLDQYQNVPYTGA